MINFFGSNIMIIIYGESLHFTTQELFHYFVYSYPSYWFLAHPPKVHNPNIVLAAKKKRTSLVLRLSAWYLYEVHCAIWISTCRLYCQKLGQLTLHEKLINQCGGENQYAIAAIVSSPWCQSSTPFEVIFAGRLIWYPRSVSGFYPGSLV